MQIKNYITEILVRTMNFKDQLLLRIKVRVLNWFIVRIEIFDNRKSKMPEFLESDTCREALEDNNKE